MENILIVLVSTFLAALFFGLQLSAPKRTLIIAPLLGIFGYFVYLYTNNLTDSEYSAAFFGTLAACMPAELFARIIKTPATVIIFISVIPLVPGVMLYQTMLYFAENNFNAGAYEITRTLIYSGAMAIAITISTMFGKHLFAPLIKLINEKKLRNKNL
ncbi:MAG: hypothetical protein A2Y15_06395 [Clostridiales bacterium GWF2_36_10]|nr:MAG: hypothetical protein A2Y15_06395 [Clostridiales bacterium GWF2_36_10]HAN21856.1 hypothetical protein [Clostridiales bacterium]